MHATGADAGREGAATGTVDDDDDDDATCVSVFAICFLSSCNSFASSVTEDEHFRSMTRMTVTAPTMAAKNKLEMDMERGCLGVGTVSIFF